jgi:putative ABC transport system permease protein
MNYFLFILRSSLEDFARNKLRTMLTSLGILIGVLSVVLLISLGLGLKKYIQNQFDSLGANLLFITPGGSTGGGVGATVRFDERDITRLKRIKGVVYSVPLATANTSASFGGKEEKNLTLVSTTADFFPTRNIKAEYGRLFTKQDADKRSKVIVIGPKVADKLFGSPDIAIGQKITIQEQKMKIIGVTEKKGGGFGGGPDIDSYMYIPNKTGYSIVNPDRKIFAMNLKISNAEIQMISTVKSVV